MLPDRFCPALSVMSVTLVYGGQRVGLIKMKLGTQLGLSPRHTVLDGDPAVSSQRSMQSPLPQFSSHICCGQITGWIKMPLGMEERPRPRRLCVRWGPSSLSPRRWGNPLPNFRPMSIVAKRLDGSKRHLVRTWALVQATLC